MSITQDKSVARVTSDVKYQIQRAVVASEQMKDACAKMELPFMPEAAIACEALELLRANTRSVQMLLLVISCNDVKRSYS
jgi:hypothetical protein